MDFYKILSLFATIRLADSGLVQQMSGLTGGGVELNEIALPADFQPETKDEDGLYSIEEIRQRINSFGSCEIQKYAMDLRAKESKYVKEVLGTLEKTCYWLGNVFGFFETFPNLVYESHVQIRSEKEFYVASRCSVKKERTYLPDLRLLWGQTCYIGTSYEFQVIYVTTIDENGAVGDIVDIVIVGLKDDGTLAVFSDTKAQCSSQPEFSQLSADLMSKYQSEEDSERRWSIHHVGRTG